jgi:glucosamine 6-phosphate synthetase-like amidotransferase/phosphosugar isomerase protein
MLISDSYELQVKDFNLYLGHTQAPTSSQRTYTYDTTHPFCCNEWVVAHNGVLTNCDKIKKRINDSTLYNTVDTSLIPALIHTFSNEGYDEVDSVIEALSYIEGTYGLWIHNKSTSNTYIARCGSTLFSNFLTNDFSSVETKGMQSLTEGTLYLLTVEGVTEVGGFDTNSPFLVI